jgi:hypothetical protein
MRSAAKVSQHGGRRNGAGRKLMAKGPRQIVTVSLSAEAIAKVQRWQEKAGCDSFSQALRQIIDAS